MAKEGRGKCMAYQPLWVIFWLGMCFPHSVVNRVDLLNLLAAGIDRPLSGFLAAMKRTELATIIPSLLALAYAALL